MIGHGGGSSREAWGSSSIVHGSASLLPAKMAQSGKSKTCREVAKADCEFCDSLLQNRLAAGLILSTLRSFFALPPPPSHSLSSLLLVITGYRSSRDPVRKCRWKSLQRNGTKSGILFFTSSSFIRRALHPHSSSDKRHLADRVTSSE